MCQDDVQIYLKNILYDLFHVYSINKLSNSGQIHVRII